MPTPSSGGSGGGGSSAHPLPAKEYALFKRILKCYEQKQYKNALKFAKQILSNPKFTEHGETLAMKGLTLNNLGRKDEAYDYVRRGLRNDLRSHVCWHVYGLLQRSDKQYDEAIKCYRNALKWDKDNIQILRDLSLLQIQMRDLDGYKDTRYQLFQLRPTQRASWIGFAMSYHLLNDHDMALKILEEFRKTQTKSAYDYEHSELLLYQNQVIQESGDVNAALEHLSKYNDQICDKATMQETRGVLQIQNGEQDKAEGLFADLIRRNPENHRYYRQLELASQADTDEKKLAMYEAYRAKYPRAQAPQRLPLEFAKGDAFRSLADPYLRKSLRKGIPPLFVDLQKLYVDPERVQILEELCLGYLKHLEHSSTFDGGETGDDGKQVVTMKEPATALLWLYYYLGQHYDHKKQYARALEYVNMAIEHTPTLIELYLLKAKIYKHLGALDEAVKWSDEAQSLDTADRYINCKAAKYLLRANRVKEAEDMCAKFTREGVSPTDNLNEMQCMWFQTECAGAYRRMGKFGEGLKKCIEVDRHFTEIVEDQFDFHTYCMRKMTLRSYVDLLRLEDKLRSHRFYEKAAHCAIQIYLRLHDRPVTDDDQLNELDTENMNPSELKKLRNRQKKARRKAEQEKAELKHQQARKEAHNKAQKKAGGTDAADAELDSPQKDELCPDKLERPDSALDEALKFLRPLQTLASDRLDTHVLAFEIYYRRQRPLLMLQCLKRALKAVGDSKDDDPRLHGCLVRFQRFVEQQREKMGEPVKAVLDKEAGEMFGKLTAVQRNDQFVKQHGKKLGHALVGAKMQVLLDQSSDQAVQLTTKLDAKSGVDLKTCSDIHDCLSGGDLGPAGLSAADAFKSQCAKLFPYAAKFGKEPEPASDASEAAKAEQNDDGAAAPAPTTKTATNATSGGGKSKKGKAAAAGGGAAANHIKANEP